MDIKALICKKNVSEKDEVQEKWFTFPVKFDYVAEVLDLPNERGQYIIKEINFKLPTKLSDKEDVTINDINRLVNKVNELLEQFPEAHLIKICNKWFKSVEQMHYCKNQIGLLKNQETFEIEGRTYTYTR